MSSSYERTAHLNEIQDFKYLGVASLTWNEVIDSLFVPIVRFLRSQGQFTQFYVDCFATDKQIDFPCLGHDKLVSVRITVRGTEAKSLEESFAIF